MKHTKHNLKKIQELLETAGYTVRYEKGNFQSGYCLVEQRKIAIVNRFFDTEARINVLLDILSGLSAGEIEKLPQASAKLFRKLIVETTGQEQGAAAETNTNENPAT